MLASNVTDLIHHRLGLHHCPAARPGFLALQPAAASSLSLSCPGFVFNPLACSGSAKKLSVLSFAGLACMKTVRINPLGLSSLRRR